MEVEYTIKFVDGAVVITEKRKADPPADRPVGQHKDIGSSVDSNAKAPPLPAEASGDKRSREGGGPEFDTDRTGGGWGTSGSGITVVFGGVYTNATGILASVRSKPDGPERQREN